MVLVSKAASMGSNDVDTSGFIHENRIYLSTLMFSIVCRSGDIPGTKPLVCVGEKKTSSSESMQTEWNMESGIIGPEIRCVKHHHPEYNTGKLL